MRHMRVGCQISAALVLLTATAVCAAAGSMYDFTVKSIWGVDVPLSAYKETNPVALVVNVASQCGYTDTNYRELQQLYEEYEEDGFIVLAFPCNQFGSQEPGSPADIRDFTTEKYGVTFPLMAKVEVNGDGEDPLFTFLKEATGSGPLKWNFSKFLVVNGVPRKHYSHSTSPSAIEDDIVDALEEVNGADEEDGDDDSDDDSGDSAEL
ncbi:thioredoxin-like protein [Tribonema minus]|uniref:Glutathione peroxidase n=1 Tax=Tribonema minus TaxID=303371 RepID=A0A835YHD0_9STRA|nr:thioredoxin-like protein [Tribonema minus]